MLDFESANLNCTGCLFTAPHATLKLPAICKVDSSRFGTCQHVHVFEAPPFYPYKMCRFGRCPAASHPDTHNSSWGKDAQARNVKPSRSHDLTSRERYLEGVWIYDSRARDKTSDGTSFLGLCGGRRTIKKLSDSFRGAEAPRRPTLLCRDRPLEGFETPCAC